ncbi:Ubiquitin carboxyl-terminal hydrolase 4 [Spathaspora sp. JA1]|nr:Ubiquitin carboxyl-terminal hydrolase 4 [Spathaspora sp. JA1]
MKSIAELQSISSNLVKHTIKSATGFPKLINDQITLLQIFNKQIKTFEKIGYCDYEIAYVVYVTAGQLLSVTSKYVNEKNKEIYQETERTLINKKSQFEEVESVLVKSEVLVPNVDPLLNRFNQLQGKSQTKEESDIIDKFKFQDQITAQELHDLLDKYKILLIDYRPKKDFLYNHINHPDIVNIEPKQLELDSDLEVLLQESLPQDQYNKFQNRHRYDLIVIYNYKYGNADLDRFSNILIDFPNPFEQLIEVLMYKNKYISSRPKLLPCYLIGGVLNWYNQFGKSALVSSPAVENGSGQINNVKSDYLTNFGEYISNSKSHGSKEYIKPRNRKNNHEEFVVTKSIESNLPPTPRSREHTPVSKQQVETSPSAPVVPSIPAQVAPALPKKIIPTVQGIVPYSPENNSTTSLNPPALPQKTPLPKDKPPAYSKTTSPTSMEKSISETQINFLNSYTTGLVNLGNSCYMNCVLQCLGATQQLTTFFFPSINNYKQHINTTNKLGSQGIVTVQFAELLANMFKSNGKTLNPKKFKMIMGSCSPNKQFETYDQQDCIEFLNYLLDTLHEDLNQMVILSPEEKRMISELTPEQEKSRETLPVRLASTIEWERYLKLNFSIIVDYFQGQLLSQLKCLQCRTTSTTYNSFSILSLPIPERKQTVSLQDCLQEFTTIELLDDNNKWYCPNCKTFTKSTKQITITRLPQVLIINFKRFKMTPNGRFNKLETFVTYPVNETLDLTQYWPKEGTSINPSRNDVMTIEKERQLLQTFPVRNQIPPFKYKLYGVANHFGNLTTGHYTSYVHKSDGRGWCYFDDARISYNVGSDKVLNKNAYCLFFQRI